MKALRLSNPFVLMALLAAALVLAFVFGEGSAMPLMLPLGFGLLRKVEETQTDTGAWAADSSGIQTDLLKNGAITRIIATAEITPSGTMATANAPDGIWRIIQNLQIAGGSHTYFTLPADDGCEGGALLHYINQHDGFGPGIKDSVITAPARTYTPVSFVYHAGSRPRGKYGADNPFDLTAFIPGTLEGRLRAIWVTSGNDVMDDATTITSAVMRYTLFTVLGSEAELRQEMAAQEVALPPGVAAMIPAWSAEVFAHSATASDYSATRNIPTGGWLKRIHLLCQDATATRTLRGPDEVTALAFKLQRDGTVLVRSFADQYMLRLPAGQALEDADAALDFGNHVPGGIFNMDLRRHSTPQNPWGKDYGINMTLPNLGTGDFQLGLTITTYAAGDDSLIIYERYLPIAAGQKIA